MKMKMKYSTWYRSGFDTKIKKKEESNYLSNDKMSHSMVFGCVYTHTLNISLH